MKSLFIPLKTEWFREYESGQKTVEYRIYGARWNERACAVGRPVTLSHGYSGRRMQAEVSGFEIISLRAAPQSARALFPHADKIAAISLRLESGLQPPGQGRQPGADHQLSPQTASLF